MTQTVSRKERRAQASVAARRYGLPGAPALDLFEAYRALIGRDLARAVTLAHQVGQRHPGNVHPWIILGTAALDRLEGKPAAAFFERAREVAPKDPLALAGLGKARVLEANPFAAVGLFEEAFTAGSDDLAMARLYIELMRKMERPGRAARALAPVAARLDDAALYHALGELFLDAEDYGAAGRAFEAAHSRDPLPLAHRIGRIKAALFAHDFARVEEDAGALLDEDPALEELISLRMTALRNLGRGDEALALLDGHFTDPVQYKRALGVSAHLALDRGDIRTAGIAFREAVHVTDAEHGWAEKAYGTFCFGNGDYAAGLESYVARQPTANRRFVPYANSAPEVLSAARRVFVMGEQGVGDQLALLPLLGLAPLAQAEVVFVGDARMEPLLRASRLRAGFIAEGDFDAAALRLGAGEIIFVGDLMRYLAVRPAGALGLGGYLRADPDKVAARRRSYEDRAAGGPIVGLSWRSSATLTGYHRSVALADLVATLPPGALAVNLQYGDCRAEIAAAAAGRTDVTLFDDPEVDQMADLDGFMAQIMALDRVVSIDNTTAHACGALGHRDCHLLIPAGADCMWYWGRDGREDRWYGGVTLHRQSAPGDWSGPLAELTDLWR